MKESKYSHLIFFVLFFLLMSFISLNRHSKTKPFTYHSELWADKAGYNVYLPAIFIYYFNANNFPDSIEYKTGNGFKINLNENKIITKYPYGVALLQSPFWLIAHLTSKNKTGYSILYNKSLDISAVFYLTLGLLLLYHILIKLQYNRNKVLSFLFISLLSTNLFYYSVFETGMSHIYSFCFFSLLLYCLYNNKFGMLLIFSVLILLLIRPINIFFILPTLFLFNINSKKEFYNRSKNLFTINTIFISIALFAIFYTPQLIYNHYAFGGYLSNPYQNEGFNYIKNPKILEVLFAPNNGLFLYCPVILYVLLILFIFSFKNSFKKFTLIFLLIIIYTALYSCWWSYMLGCGFGHRGIVDILPIFIFYFYLFYIQNKNKVSKLLILIFTIITLKLTFSFDGCFYGKNDWDWLEYKNLLIGKTK